MRTVEKCEFFIMFSSPKDFELAEVFKFEAEVLYLSELE